MSVDLPSILLRSALCTSGFSTANFFLSVLAQIMKAFIGRRMRSSLSVPWGVLTIQGEYEQSVTHGVKISEIGGNLVEVLLKSSMFSIILSDNKLKHADSFLYINTQVLCMSLKIDEREGEKYVNQCYLITKSMLKGSKSDVNVCSPIPVKTTKIQIPVLYCDCRPSPKVCTAGNLKRPRGVGTLREIYFSRNVLSTKALADLKTCT